MNQLRRKEISTMSKDNLNDSATNFNNRINLAAIKKEDPYAREIVDFSSYVALYKYKKDWEKTGIEGTFFIYSRGNIEPRYSIFINNTKSQTNHVEPISKHIEFQNQPPFLLYRNEKSEINGFWFGTSDCDRIHDLLNNLIKEMYSGQQAKLTNGNHGNNGQEQGMDIFSMLSRAQEEYQKNNKGRQNIPVKPVQNQQQQQQQQLQLHQQQPQQQPQQQHHHHNPELARQFSNMYIQKEHQHHQPAPIELSSIFAAAQNPKSKGQQPGPMIQPIHTVDEIEKHQQRVFSPSVIQNAGAGPGKSINSDPNLLTSIMKTNVQPVGPFSNQMQPIQNPRPFVHHENQGFQQMPQMVQQKMQPQPLLGGPPGKPTLMPPTMFMPSKEEAAGIPGPSAIKPEPLTQNQLLQALNYLLQNDPDFIKKVHEAYLKTILNNF